MKSRMQGRLKLTKLILAGENKKDAIINFKGGLNVIAGASDTGKSFAFECIDFALGSSSNPKTVPEMKGYRSVFLEIEDIGQEEIFTLKRNFSEDEKNEIFIYYSNYQEKDAAEVEKLSVTHNAKKSLSKKLLNCCDCTYKYVMKNTKGDTRAFTFRSFSPLIMINELRITARHSPIYHTDSRGSTFATPARTAFKTVISGIDYKKEEKKENTEIIKAKLKGKIEQLSQIIDEIRIENNELIKDTEDINTEKSIEIIELNKFIKEKSEEIKKYELDYKEIQTEIEIKNTELKHLLNNNNKFVLLKKNYLSDLERLEFIYDAFDLTQQLVEVECPICHSPMKVNEMEKSDDYYEALATEKIKIEVQLAELDETIKDLSDEIISKKQRISKLENYKEEITDNLNNNLGPIVAEKVKKVQELMDAQERINLITRNEKRINKYNTEISKWQEKIDSTGQEKRKKIEDLPEAYTNELCKEIKFLLQGCDFIGKEGKIKYNNATEDVEVGEKEKASYGKGARAIINSTFLIGIMNYCYKRNLCHPGIVVLDSPLTTYKEKDKKDGDDETITKGTKEKFYEMLAEQKNGQIIIFDNEEPSSTVKTKINYLHFSGDSTVGRKGLIP
ncbi:hypothetical protein DWY35_01355 [Ruminococcus sp. AF25-13]|jgi:hypothetical protein|nr:hypothetical protein DXD07_05910 [Ruminococcus sp. TF10-6]RGF30705.1 hypothetical protein DW106_00815 [Ruminococcus sp. AM09-18-1]RGG31519.1 hypothetical protein DWY35_01355 [Ruminococcus sp. AF25-13]RGG38635.1 hypothetical protein DWY13_07430 [Ruminococcus sp. AF24-16]RGI15751.1 hypothetical protein DXD00_06405 [Ruminococcus sp. TF10-12AC]